ncbi:MAG: radical SAM protein [Candidatus Riflebacteria bacterium]|nr:radical SAM protein [Candidatus Riflebacteria bacterium]
MDYKLVLMITGKCNLACDYCYNRHHVDENTMSMEIACRAIRLAAEKVNAGESLTLHFFGGEPLTAYELMTDIQKEATGICRSRDISLVSSCSTNGTLLTAEKYKNLEDLGIETMLSLDGIKVAQDTHRRFPDGGSSYEVIKRLWEEKIIDAEKILVNIVLTPKNIVELTASVSGLVEIGFRKLSFSPDYSADWNENARQAAKEAFVELIRRYSIWMRDELPVYFSFVEEKIRRLLMNGRYEWVNPCSFGTREIAVAPDGSIFPCERFICKGAKSGFCIGNIMIISGIDLNADSGRIDAGHGKEDSKIRGHKRCGLPNICLNCNFRAACTNACGCVNFERTGDIDCPDELICFFERLFIESAQLAMKMMS